MLEVRRLVRNVPVIFTRFFGIDNRAIINLGSILTFQENKVNPLSSITDAVTNRCRSQRSEFPSEFLRFSPMFISGEHELRCCGYIVFRCRTRLGLLISGGRCEDLIRGRQLKILLSLVSWLNCQESEGRANHCGPFKYFLLHCFILA